MKKILSVMAIVFSLGLSTMAIDAEAAKRVGSGKSVGTQRQATQDKAPGSPAQSAAAAPAAGAAAAAPARSWLGPVAGLAAGLGLAALASSMGFGGELASMVMMGLLAVGVMLAIGFFMRKRAAAQQQSQGGVGNLLPAHAHAGHPEHAAPAYKVEMPQNLQTLKSTTTANTSAVGIGSAIGSSLPAQQEVRKHWPADFDTAGFERNAKVNFIRLQAANDVGNLDDIRQFTTPQMFAELKMDLSERGGTHQQSEVAHLNAKVINVEEGATHYVVSVQFSGFIKDATGAGDESFDEVWHFEKPVQGAGGWGLSGIQQAV